jgi:uncharacterized membrane protein
MHGYNDLRQDLRHEPPVFSAVITPHRSLAPAGFRTLMLILGGICFTTGMVFLLAGAWPVCGFFVLDVLLVYLAFRASYRSAKAYEEVTMTPSELRVRQVSHRGRMREWMFNPLWVRLDRERHEEFGLVHLFLVSRRLRLAIARCLGPREKESFATALAAALGEVRRGPTRTTMH